MRLRITVGALVFVLPAAMQAAKPNIEPGQWQYEMTTQIDAPGNQEIPEQSRSRKQCVTQDDLGDGVFGPGQRDNCEVLSEDITRSSMSTKMECKQGGRTTIATGEMEFNGDQASGTFETEVEMPNGTMTSTTEIEAERLGDC